LAAGASQTNDGPLPILDAAARFGRLAVPEVELLTELSIAEAHAALWRHVERGKLEPVSALTGTLFGLL
jgi:hypothetical protein